MSKINIRYQQLKDAKRFFNILNNKNFIYFPARPKTLAEEKRHLRKCPVVRRQKIAYDYTVLLDREVVGAVGIKINQERKFIAEIGYFVDEKYWGQGIAVQAVKLAEQICFKKLKIKRIEIIMDVKNKASQKVAIKSGYKKEGLMKKSIKGVDGKLKDAYLYAKTL